MARQKYDVQATESCIMFFDAVTVYAEVGVSEAE